MALTKDVIFLSHPNTSKIVDAIPLFELEDIILMNNEAKEGKMRSDNREVSKSSPQKKDTAPSLPDVDGDIKFSDTKAKKNGKSNKLKFLHSFQIRTITEGYNSGRQYIMQADSDEQRVAMMALIRKLAKVSREKFLAKSRFLKAQACPISPRTVQPIVSPLCGFSCSSLGACRQEFVRKYYKSAPVQSLVALLIVLVKSMARSSRCEATQRPALLSAKHHAALLLSYLDL